MVVRLASIGILSLFLAGVASAPAPAPRRLASPAFHRSLRPAAEEEEQDGQFVHAVSKIEAHPVFFFRV